MSKGFRRLFFYTLVLVFFLAGTGAVLYGQGWRVDLASFSLKKVGALYIRSFPANAQISLDDELVENKTGIFQSGTLINHLFPRSYNLSLQASGFKDWNLPVTVKPSLVTEIKYAVLLPTEPTEVVSSTTLNFWMVQNDLLLEDSKGELQLGETRVPGSKLLEYSSDGAYLLTSNAGNFYLYDRARATSTNLFATVRSLGIRNPSGQFQIDPSNGRALLLRNSSALRLINLNSNQIAVLATSSSQNSIQASAISPFWIAWVTFSPQTNQSQIALYDKILGVRRDAPSVPNRIVKISWSRNNILGLLDERGELSLHQLGSNTVRPLASDVKDFFFSEDGDRVAILENKSLEIFSLTDQEYWRFNLPDIRRASHLEWYRDNWNIFIHYPDHVSFLSLEDKSLVSFNVLIATNQARYQADTNQFFYLKDSKLYRLDFAR